MTWDYQFVGDVHAGHMETIWDVSPESEFVDFSIYAWQSTGPMIFCETANSSIAVVLMNWLFV